MGGICVGVTSSAGSVYLAETIQESYRPSQGIIISLFGTSGKESSIKAQHLKVFFF